MYNHLHLLATPATAQSIPKTMQSVGRRYAQYFNKQYHRSVSLWEGRYKSSLVGNGKYLLSCYRYIELTPLGLVLLNTQKIIFIQVIMLMHLVNLILC